MKLLRLLLLLPLLFIYQNIRAQCPPPNFPNPTSYCQNAPILCENLDGYCATLGVSQPSSPLPGCNPNQYVLNNPAWFAFYAGSNTISVQITPDNCTPGSQMGLQGGIYGGCSPPVTVMDVQCACTTSPFTLSSNNFVIGQIYWIVMDGCGGNICDYSIVVTAGSTVQQPPADPGPISGPETVCQGTTTSYNIAPPVGATIYNWTLNPPLGTVGGNPNNNVNINWGNTPGTTELCVTVENQCLANPTSSCYTIEVEPVPTATLSGSGLICESSSGPPGTVDLTVSFTGNAPWTFTYAINGATQPPITTSDNPYTLTVSESGTITLVNLSSGEGNCPGTVSGSSTISLVKLTPSYTSVSATCGQSNGSIDLTPGGGNAPYTFIWSNSADTEDLQDVLPGSYTVTITDSNGCTATLTAQVNDVNNQPAVNSTTTPSTCEMANGSINITVSGGASPYTYQWSDGSNSEDLNDLDAGTYTVTVTGADGCTTTATINLTNNNPPISINGSTLPNTTCIGGNGSVAINVAPPVPPGGGNYTYNWSNGETTPNLTDLEPGSYTVTVNGGGACTQTATFTVADQPNTPNISSNTTPSVCELDNGSINITVSGGVPPFTFNWSNGETTEDLTNILAGNYSVTVTGANGCSNSTAINLTNNNPPINVTATVMPNTTCIGGNGSITVNIVPPSPPGGGSYTYSWSNGDSGVSLTNLTSGSYTVTVDGGGACTQTATFTVPNQPNLPMLSQTVTPASCGLSNGVINLMVSGGVAPYTFNWSNGEMTEDLINVLGGSYQVTVTGANGCSTSTSIAVPNNTISFTVTPNILPNTSCNSSTNGSISLTVSPNGSYTYSWNSGQQGSTITGLASGSYTVTVSAGGNCTQVLTYVVPSQPSQPSLTSTVTPATCGESNGSITAIPSGGVGPYTYVWSNGSTSQIQNNMPGGSYSVTVTGQNGCTSSANFTIPDNPIPITITPTITANTSCTTPNGAISISVQPVNATINWSNGVPGTELMYLAPGSYSVTVSAGGTCMETANFVVPDNSEEPNVALLPTPSSCNLPNGAIDMSISGGLSPYSISWSNGATTLGLDNLMAGTYSVIVTSSTGCIGTASATVPNNDPVITVNGLTQPNTSCGFPNGGISVSVSPPGNYDIQWSIGASGEYLDNLPAGTYSVVVSGGGTCVVGASFEVSEFTNPPSLNSSVTPATCGEGNGSVNLTVTGGSWPLSYSWSNGATTEDLTNIEPGIYTVTVTDASSCTATTSATVSNNTVPVNLSGSASPNTSCNGANGAINISVSPSGTYSYLWSNGETTEDISSLAPGSYTVTVSAGGECTATASYTVANQTESPVISEDITAAICGESNGAISLTVTGATSPYTFVWSNTETTQAVSNLAPGDYSVTVTSIDGCTSTATYNVQNNSSDFTLEGAAQPINTCLYDNGAINLSITPPGSYNIQWSNGATTEDLDSLSAGTYTVVVTESGSCSASASFTIGNITLIPNASAAVTAALCGLDNGAIDLTVSDGAAPYSFAWSNGETTEDLPDIPGGAYSVVVTGADGCTSSVSANVPDNSISFSVDGVANPNTSCDVNNGGIDLTVTPSGAYTFIWSNGETTEDLSSLQGGSYTVTVSAGGTCTSEASFNVGSTTADPVIAQSVTATICGESNGAIDLSVSGGVAPFNFEWSNGETTEDLIGLAPGSYSVEVTGANGCAVTGNYTVPNNDLVFSVSGTASANTSCGDGNGSIEINVAPAGSYNYLWSGGETTEDIAGLDPGSYQITVSVGVTCTASASFTVQDNPDVPALSQSTTASICGAPDGGIDLTVTGGPTPYQFEWSNGETTEDLTGLVAGTYSVIVTAANGCTATGSYSVANISNTFTFTGSMTANTLCVDGNGSIDLTVTPAGSYAFIWSNNETTEGIYDLIAGTYSVTISDGGSCTASDEFVITDNTPVVVLNATTQDVLCFGESTGSIQLTAGNGVEPYSFDWSPAIAGNPQNPDNLAAGAYSVTATDASGCTAELDIAIDQTPTAIQVGCAQSGHVSLPGMTDGEATVNIAGGVGPYTVSWSPGGSQSNVPEGSFIITNLGVGDYTVEVTDALGCTAICNFTASTDDCITAIGTMQAAQLSACASECITANYNSFGQYLDQDDVLQFILHQGSGNTIANEIARSDQPTFCFDPSLMNYGTTYYISAAAGNDDGAGNVDLSDICKKVSIGTPIVFYEIPVAGIAPPDSITCIETQTVLSGSSSVAGSSFSWSTLGGDIIGDPTQAGIQAGAGGIYTLIVDANGCSDTASVQVIDLQTQVNVSLTSSPGEILDCVVSQVQLTTSVSGTNNPAYSWLLNGTQLGTGSAYTANATGTYQVIVTDLPSGCTGTAYIFIEDDSNFPPLFVNTPSELNCRDTVVAISGGSDINGVQFFWATISGTDTTIVGQGANLSVGAPGAYYLVGVAPNGCQNAEVVTVNANLTAPNANAGQDATLDCVQTPVTLTGSGSQGVSFHWTVSDPSIVITSPGSPGITVNQAGVYTLTVTDLGNYCTDTDDAEVFQYENVPQGEVSIQSPSCFGEKDGYISIDSDSLNGPYQYRLNGKNYGGNNVFAPLSAGYYQLQVTDGQGCVWTTEVYLPDPDQLTVSLGDNLVVSLGESVTLQVMPSVPLWQLDTIMWSPPELFPCPEMPCDQQEIAPTEETDVRVTIIDENGCVADNLLSLFVRKDRNIYVPNSFSPNGDGVNDVFMIFAGKDVTEVKSFLVFNRWGETVFQYHDFEPNNPAFGWDGTHRGQVMNPAVFTWYAIVEFIDGKEKLFKGDVILMK